MSFAMRQIGQLINLTEVIMYRAVIAASVVVLSSYSALAQTGSIKTQSQLDSEVNAFFADQLAGQITPFDQRQTLLDMIASSGTPTGLPVADPRNFTTPAITCSGGVNASTGIAAAITAGYTRIRLPAGCFYQPPTNSGNEVVPAGIQIIGDNGDPNLGLFSQVQTLNRATSSDGLYLAKGASLQNVAVQSYFCDQTVNPQATQKVCPVGFANNIGDQTQGVTNWAYETLFLSTGTSTTQPGATSTDTPIIGLIQNSLGDAIFTATSGGGISHRIYTGGISGDQGILIQNGFNGSAGNIHTGFHCAEYGTNSQSSCVTLERTNGATAPMELFEDDGSGTATASWQEWIVQFQSGGNLRSTFQTGTAFSGIFDLINAGNGGGTFSGQFVNYQIGGVSKFEVDATGSLFSAGALASSAPNTQTGATYSVSTSDSSIIANRAGTVTLTLLSPSLFPGRWLTVKTVQAQTVVSASSNVVPRGSTTAGTAILAAAAGNWADLQSDGTNWIIMRGTP